MSNQLAQLKQQLESIPKTPSGKRKFDRVFRAKVIQCYKQGLVGHTQITKELKLSSSTLTNWMKGRKKLPKNVIKNKFKRIKITNDIQEVHQQVSNIEIHLPNKIIIKNVDWGYVEKIIYQVPV